MTSSFHCVPDATHFPLQVHYYVYRMQCVTSRLRQSITSLSRDDRPSLLWVCQVKTTLNALVSDWHQVRDEFHRQSRVFSHLVALIIFPVSEQILLWLYYLTNASPGGGHDGVAAQLASVAILSSCCTVLICITFISSQVDHQRQEWIKALFSFLYHTYHADLRSRLWLTKVQKKIIREIERDEPDVTHWAVKCWPTNMTISYAGSLRILIELGVFYMLLIVSTR